MLRRTPLRRRTRLSPRTLKKLNGAPAWRLRAELDRLARKACMIRANWMCEKCCKTERVQWHHVYTRAIISLRHDLDNLVVLCAGCHLWAHHEPLEFAAWFEQKFGQARVGRLRMARATRRKTDAEALLISLRRLSGESEKGGDG